VVVVLAGIGLYVALPALLEVIGSWPQFVNLAPWWLTVTFLSQVGSFLCSAALMRLVIPGSTWFATFAAELAGNAVTNVVPSAGAAGAGLQYRMLVTSGLEGDRVVGGLTATGVLGVAGVLILPVFALPVVFGGVAVSPGLVHAAELGVVGFALVLTFGVVALFTDGLLVGLGRAWQWLLSRVIRRRRVTRDLSHRLLEQRDLVRSVLGENWWRATLLVAGHIGLDYMSLLAALRATGARPNPAMVLLAYAATGVVALVPITPGGLGIVEASLSGLLVLSSVSSSAAVVATFAYRLAAYWLPIVGGGALYVLFRRRYGVLESAERSA